MIVINRLDILYTMSLEITQPFTVKLPCKCTYRLKSVDSFIIQVQEQIRQWIDSKWSDEFYIYFCYKHRHRVQYSYEKMYNKINIYFEGRLREAINNIFWSRSCIRCPNSKCPNNLKEYTRARIKDIYYISIPCQKFHTQYTNYPGQYSDYYITSLEHASNIPLKCLDGTVVKHKNGKYVLEPGIETGNRWLYQCDVCKKKWCNKCISDYIDPDGPIHKGLNCVGHQIVRGDHIYKIMTSLGMPNVLSEIISEYVYFYEPEDYDDY